MLDTRDGKDHPDGHNWEKTKKVNTALFSLLVFCLLLRGIGVTTLFIEPGSPWENGYVESFNGKLRDGLLNGEIFTTLLEAKVLIENWRREYNTIRPHSSLGYKPPVPETRTPYLQNFLADTQKTRGSLTLRVVQ